MQNLKVQLAGAHGNHKEAMDQVFNFFLFSSRKKRQVIPKLQIIYIIKLSIKLDLKFLFFNEEYDFGHFWHSVIDLGKSSCVFVTFWRNFVISKTLARFMS